MNLKNIFANFIALAALAATLTISVAAQSGSAQGAETVAQFNPAAFETPESIQIDRRGNIYISMALTGEIRKIATNGTQSSLAFLPIRPDVQPCGDGSMWRTRSSA